MLKLANCKYCNKRLKVKLHTPLIVCSKCRKTNQDFRKLQEERNIKREKTNLIKYGYKNQFNNKQKLLEISMERYGVSNPAKSSIVIDKIRRTCLRKYKVDNYFKSEKFHKKLKQIRKQNGKNKYFTFTRPHRFLKNLINNSFANNTFETEQHLYLNNKRISIDELDKLNKIALFVDGNFWHADPNIYNATDKVIQNSTAESIWQHDKSVNDTLRNNNFLVLRFWENNIYNKSADCLKTIDTALKNVDKILSIRRLSNKLTFTKIIKI
jgi:G:T-mismatch repair DNA endonuclease (very short patch repair protein)